jgi:putative membrane protein
MIVMKQPSALRLFFIMQGSIVPRIINKIIGVAILSALVLVIDKYLYALPHVSISAVGIFGIALSLFLGFRNNAAYDRWWEGRKLWGQLIADVRNFCRNAEIFVQDKTQRYELYPVLIVFAHLHRRQLRGVPKTLPSEDLTKWLSDEHVKQLLDHKNPADAALRQIAQLLSKAEVNGAINGFGQRAMAEILTSLSNSQAGAERIATTPLPFVYSLLVRRTTYLYCFILPFALIDSTSWFAPFFAAVVAYVFFGLQAVTNELEHPFSNVQNGLPLDAMCRTIEISVCEAMGKTPPSAFDVKNHVLT